MNLRFLALGSALAFAAIAGCYTASPVDTNGQRSAPTVDTNGTDPAPAGDDDDDSDGGGVAPLTGLPCDLAMLLQTACGDCHGTKPSHGADSTILSYGDLSAPSSDNPGKTVADDALARMKSTKAPMPPDQKLGANEIDILAKWISDGMPKGSCGAPASKPDAGKTTKRDAGAEPPAPAPAPVSVCTSGVMTPIDHYGSTMRPGTTCIACHAANQGPPFTLAGTVYPTVNEPDECSGSPGTTEGLKVLIIDATGALRAMPVNASGNFSSSTALATPYRALIVRGNSIREMKSTQTDGDCNGCHSEWGTNGAPGRLFEP